MKYNICMLLFLLSISYIGINSSYSNSMQIPNLGDTSSRFMSISQENKIGDIIHAQILGSFNLNSDPIVNNYIRLLGNKLLNNNFSDPIKYRFLVANDSTINAFATPGGIIVINSGIFLKTKSEAELAGILAHEIAHIKARHLSRMYEESSQVNITSALTILASIIASMYDSSNLGKTFIAGKNISATNQIKFIRENEKEADRMAIEILIKANINPNGMSSFFETLSNEENDSNSLEFLRTHPVTKNRIIEAQNLASQYEGTNFINDSYEYQLVSERIKIEKLDTKQFVNNYKQDSTNKINKNYIIDNYKYCLALIEQGKNEKAIEVIKNIIEEINLTKDSYNIKKYLYLTLSEAYFNNNNEKSIEILENLNKIYSTDGTTLIYLANAYLKNNDYKKVLDILIPYVVENKDHNLIKKISEAAYKLKNNSLGHEYQGDYHKILGKFNSAIKFYRLAVKYNMKGKTIAERINSKIKEIERLQETKEIL